MVWGKESPNLVARSAGRVATVRWSIGFLLKFLDRWPFDAPLSLEAGTLGS